MIFTGKSDRDSAPEAISGGDYRTALNMSNSVLMTPGGIQALPSSKAINYTWPAGINKIIGTKEDKDTQSLIVFIYNNLDNHRIIRMYDLNGVVLEVAGGAGLEFNSESYISSAVIIDGEHLYWVDGRNALGSEPRHLNINKSITDGKALHYELYAGESIPLGTEITISLSNGGTVIFEQSYTTTIIYNSREEILEYLYFLIIADFEGLVYAEKCDCKLALQALAPGDVLTINGYSLILAPDNHYVPSANTIPLFATYLAKQPPTCAPMATYVSDVQIEFNNVRNFCGQFRTRYVYDDGGASPWSAISIIPLNNNQVSLNAIRIDYSDPRLTNPIWLGLIKHVDIAYRDGNDGLFRLIQRVPACEFGTIIQHFDFYNDKRYSVIPSDDVSTLSADTQVLMNDHNVPYKGNTIEAVSDQNGDTHLVVGGIHRGFDQPECLDCEFTSEIFADDCLIDIVGTVNIINDPSVPLSDPDYKDYLGFFVVYLSGTRYFALSDNPADGTGTGAFAIRNIPKGKYSLRVAHYMCRFGSDKGPQFDLLNGIEWQRTSAPVIDVAGGFLANGVATERFIDLTSFTGDTFDLDTEVGYGDIKIQNAHSSLTISGKGLVEVYLCDNFGVKATVADRTASLNCENQQVSFYVYDLTAKLYSGVVNRRGDHNGYAYAYMTPDLGLNQLETVRIYAPSWEPLAPSPSPVGDTAPSDHLYGGTWFDIEEDTAIDLLHDPGVGYPNLHNSVLEVPPTNGQYLCYLFNGDPTWSGVRRRTATSTVLDTNFNQVANALVWMMQHGRPARTSPLGEFTLTVFGFEGSNSLGPDQDTYSTYENDPCGDYPAPPAGTSGGILTMWSLPSVMFQYGFAGGVVPMGRYLKSGGVYKMGVVYEDDFGRSPGVAPCGTLRIPFHTKDGQFAQRRGRFSINSKPPIWATRYRIVRTIEGYYLNYAQLPVADAIYVRIGDGYDIPSPTSYSSGNATHVMLQVAVNQSNLPVTTQTLIMFRENNPDGYRAKTGDRVRYLLDENQETVLSGDVLDVAVVGEYIDDDKYYVVITYDNIQMEIKKDWVFEFYTPKETGDEIFYETGVCLPILEPGTAEARHSGIDQDQTFFPDLPATGEILSGDTYWYRRDYILYGGQGYTMVPESSKVRLLDSDECEDIGRPFAYDPYAKGTFLSNRIVISGAFVPNSEVNDLSVFGSIDFININRVFGPIRKLVMSHSSLLAICEFKTQPIYVSKETMIDLSGQTLVGRTSALLNIADSTVSDAGTTNPESVCVQDSDVFWWDLRNATVWKYGPNGIQDIRSGQSSYFRAVAKIRKPINRVNDIVISGYDRRYRQWFLTFQDALSEREPVIGSSIVWVESSSGWGFDFSPRPTYGAIGESMYVMSPGLIHKMYEGVNYLNILGTQLQGDVTFVENRDPFVNKEWQHLKVLSTKRIYVTEVRTGPTPEYPGGMVSKIPIEYWMFMDGQQFAPFLRDQADPHQKFTDIPNTALRTATALIRGRYLKGPFATITLRILAPGSGNILTFADVRTKRNNLT